MADAPYTVADKFALAVVSGYFPESVKVGETFVVVYVYPDQHRVTLESALAHEEHGLKTKFWEFSYDDLAAMLASGELVRD